VTLPHHFAVRVERDDLTRAEPCVDHLAIADRAWRRQIVLVVDASQLSLRLDPMLPEPPAVAAVKGFHQKGGLVRRERSRAGPAERTLALIGGIAALHEPRMVTLAPESCAELRRDEYPIADDNRRRDAEPADRGFPRHVFGGAPLHGQTGFSGRARAARSAPLRPVCRGERTTGEVNQDECESYTT
jgi:hypothetical protein